MLELYVYIYREAQLRGLPHVGTRRRPLSEEVVFPLSARLAPEEDQGVAAVVTAQRERTRRAAGCPIWYVGGHGERPADGVEDKVVIETTVLVEAQGDDDEALVHDLDVEAEVGILLVLEAAATLGSDHQMDPTKNLVTRTDGIGGGQAFEVAVVQK